MATNRADTLDPALLRPGRLDRKIEFPLPDRRQKRLIFSTITSKMNLSDEVSTDANSSKEILCIRGYFWKCLFVLVGWSGRFRSQTGSDIGCWHQRNLSRGRHARCTWKSLHCSPQRFREGLQEQYEEGWKRARILQVKRRLFTKRRRVRNF